MSLILDRYPLTYRAEITGPLMSLVRRGESGCVVGLAGVGKSNLVHFLEQPEVQAHYLSATDLATDTHVVSISCQPGTRHKNEIFDAMLTWTWGIAARSQVDLHMAQLPGPSPLQSLRIALQELCSAAPRRIVFILDEFEELLRYQPPDFFDDLRALRDDHRTTGAVSFIVFTHRMPQLIPGPSAGRNGKFLDLVRDHIYPLGPYGWADGEGMLETLIRRSEEATPDKRTRRELLGLSGCHAGLLRAIFSEFHPGDGSSAAGLAKLATGMKVRAACEHVWAHLHSEEQGALRRIVHGDPVDEAVAGFLQRRGLLSDRETRTVFSPVFHEYVSQQQTHG